MQDFDNTIKAATDTATEVASEVVSGGSLQDIAATVADGIVDIEQALDQDLAASSPGMGLIGAGMVAAGPGNSLHTLNPADMLDNLKDFERRINRPESWEDISDTAGDIVKSIDDWQDMLDGPDTAAENLIDVVDALGDLAGHAGGYLTADNAVVREAHYQGMRVALNSAIRNLDELV